MTPVHCRVKHSPEDGLYGDCLRACVATIMDREPEQVEHFADGGVDAETINDRMVEWLGKEGYAPFWCHYDPDYTLAELMEMQSAQNHNTVYMLFGLTSDDEPHVVVCKGGYVVHNPSWYPNPLVAPGRHGAWSVMVIAKL